MSLRSAFLRPQSYGVTIDEHLTFNPTLQSMGFTGISSIVIPFNQQLFDKLGEATTDEEIPVTNVLLFDAWNHQMDNSFIKNPIMTCTDRFMFEFKCDYPLAPNGIIKSQFWNQPSISRKINQTLYM